MTRPRAGGPRSRGTITGRPVLGPTQYVLGDLTPVVKKSGGEVGH